MQQAAFSLESRSLTMFLRMQIPRFWGNGTLKYCSGHFIGTIFSQDTRVMLLYQKNVSLVW